MLRHNDKVVMTFNTNAPVDTYEADGAALANVLKTLLTKAIPEAKFTSSIGGAEVGPYRIVVDFALAKVVPTDSVIHVSLPVGSIGVKAPYVSSGIPFYDNLTAITFKFKPSDSAQSPIWTKPKDTY
jgi:hypothetical protein